MGSIWAYIGRDVLFRYTPTGEGATGPWTFLAGRTGYVQADAATVFDRLFTGRAAHAVEVGCLAHARRKLVALQDMDCRVAYPLTLITRLYRIEHLADARGLAPDDRAGCGGNGPPPRLRPCTGGAGSRVRRSRRARTSPKRRGIS
jgi:transposase